MNTVKLYRSGTAHSGIKFSLTPWPVNPRRNGAGPDPQSGATHDHEGALYELLPDWYYVEESSEGEPRIFDNSCVRQRIDTSCGDMPFVTPKHPFGHVLKLAKPG